MMRRLALLLAVVSLIVASPDLTVAAPSSGKIIRSWEQRLTPDGHRLVAVGHAPALQARGSRTYCYEVSYYAYWFVWMWTYGVCQNWSYDGTQVTSFREATDYFSGGLGVQLVGSSTDTQAIGSFQVEGHGNAKIMGSAAGYPVRTQTVDIWISGDGYGTASAWYSVK